LAVATESVVQVHDIRKSKLLFSKTAKDISCIAFDVTGKYLAYGSRSNGVQWGVSGVHVVTTKEGNDVCRVGDDTAVNNIVWTCPSKLVTSGSDDRQVRFYGIQDEKE
jgi:WD40 repeat protein